MFFLSTWIWIRISNTDPDLEGLRIWIQYGIGSRSVINHLWNTFKFGFWFMEKFSKLTLVYNIIRFTTERWRLKKSDTLKYKLNLLFNANLYCYSFCSTCLDWYPGSWHRRPVHADKTPKNISFCFICGLSVSVSIHTLNVLSATARARIATAALQEKTVLVRSVIRICI